MQEMLVKVSRIFFIDNSNIFLPGNFEFELALKRDRLKKIQFLFLKTISRRGETKQLTGLCLLMTCSDIAVAIVAPSSVAKQEIEGVA